MHNGRADHCAELIIDNQLVWPVACVVAIAACVVVGAINGLLVCVIKLNSFIATLGSGTLVLGITEWYTSNQQITGPLHSIYTT